MGCGEKSLHKIRIVKNVKSKIAKLLQKHVYVTKTIQWWDYGIRLGWGITGGGIMVESYTPNLQTCDIYLFDEYLK